MAKNVLNVARQHTIQVVNVYQNMHCNHLLDDKGTGRGYRQGRKKI